jgi:putative FmdB family regulatory protein
MPNYDYVCLDCGDEFEAFQMMSAKPLDACTKCGGKLKRLIGTGAGFVFKGAPVSETDYRLTKSYKEGEKKESGSSENKSTSEKKSESKASKKAETAKKD